ncbi:hypothetical protein NQ318_022656 [Aromia moschata]|uniref:Uncharacterized protein n=1 Tax=Aromia moschata TaxID=1265417 RepID=A0AAV8YMS0_9CUCU|nr:hypothetical protein NQ318_022656 [Aromia moschata]
MNRARKTKYLVFIFYKLARIMSMETLRNIYYALFNSIVLDSKLKENWSDTRISTSDTNESSCN